jgi:DNA-directed RNA polymerase specialized sigma24 family protein
MDEQTRDEQQKIDELISRFEDEYVRKIELEKGATTWSEFLVQQRQAICGVGRTWCHIFRCLDPGVRKQIVRVYADDISRRIGPGRCDLAGLKEVVGKTLQEILVGGKVVMDKEGENFLSYLYYIVRRAYLTAYSPKQDEEYRDHQEEDEDAEARQLLGATIIELDHEAAVIEAIAFKEFLDRREPDDQEILQDYEAGHGIRYTAARKKCGKSKIAERLVKLKQKKKEELGEV